MSFLSRLCYPEWEVYNAKYPDLNFKHYEFALRDYECTSIEAKDLLAIEYKFIGHLMSEYDFLSDYLD